MEVTKLNEKAVLVKLTRRRVNLVHKDQVAEAYIQDELGDAGLVVMKRLFIRKDNPVRLAFSQLDAAYAYHKRHTVPYIDAGPRVLPNALYMEYTGEMRPLIAEVDRKVDFAVLRWDDYVQQDIDERTAAARMKQQLTGKAPKSLPDASEYPTAAQFRASTSVDLRFIPLPDRRHFLFDLSEEDERAFAEAEQRIEELVKVDVVKRMLVPLQHLADKLSKPIGTEGAVFRDSAVENVIEGIDIAKKLDVSDNPELKETIGHLSSTVALYGSNIEWLRESPVVRKQAADKLADVAAKMSAFMTGVAV